MKFKVQRGFSLVEMLVYIALLVVVTTAALALLLNFTDAFTRYRAEKILVRQLHEATERMVYDIQNAAAVNTVGSTFDVSPGTLMLDRVGSSVTYTLSSGAITVAEDANPAVVQTSDAVTVSDLTFSHLTNARTEMVRVSVTGSVTVGDYTATETFETSAVIRGSYE